MVGVADAHVVAAHVDDDGDVHDVLMLMHARGSTCP